MGFLLGDACMCPCFDVAGGAEVVVYCWDRGMNEIQFDKIVNKVACSRNVKGHSLFLVNALFVAVLIFTCAEQFLCRSAIPASQTSSLCFG